VLRSEFSYERICDSCLYPNSESTAWEPYRDHRLQGFHSALFLVRVRKTTRNLRRAGTRVICTALRIYSVTAIQRKVVQQWPLASEACKSVVTCNRLIPRSFTFCFINFCFRFRKNNRCTDCSRLFDISTYSKAGTTILINRYLYIDIHYGILFEIFQRQRF
jgi:hypothetical protein